MKVLHDLLKNAKQYMMLILSFNLMVFYGIKKDGMKFTRTSLEALEDSLCDLCMM